MKDVKPIEQKVLSTIPGMPKDTAIVDTILSAGIDTYCLVADSVFATMDQYVADLAAEGRVNRWVMPSERSIPAVAAGRWLATGQLTAMSMQNSGFSNAMDYLRTVLLVHKIPGLVLSSWRGFDAQLDESEPHIVVGDLTESDTIVTMGEGHVFGHRYGHHLLEQTHAALSDALAGNLACLRVSPQGFNKSYPLRFIPDARIPQIDLTRYYETSAKKGMPFQQVQKQQIISREEALHRIHEEMKGLNPFYIVGNGFNPRAMQALRITEDTFENAGGMGSSLAIAWGAAKSNPNQVFVAVEGDQNAVMNEMEKVICSDYPENLYWYILNNGSGESVGPSLSLPLAPWHYELARVINTHNIEPNSFSYPRINASGLKFDMPEAAAITSEIGNLPAQARLARIILERKEIERRNSIV
ncbi:MAG: thiamine pyrophosphate-dependent enzyme [Flavobacteriales bacterium]|jgi:sulfopyruvate decarboxylase TPP-binding subunit